jgi:hypothetical protein
VSVRGGPFFSAATPTPAVGATIANTAITLNATADRRLAWSPVRAPIGMIEPRETQNAGPWHHKTSRS